MNEILKFLNSHVSCRKFTDKKISNEDEMKIITTAQRSATSSNLQVYSIIGVKDKIRKDKLAKLSGGQAHVSESALFLIFCADLYRLAQINKKKNYDFFGEFTEIFIIATVDATLAACRALQAAQALNMGGVMVGGIRNNPQEISELLELPDLVYPVMGMSLGYPKTIQKIKPRLNPETIYFNEKYSSKSFAKNIDEYDKIISDLGYLRGREVEPDKYPNFSGDYSWSEHTARRMASDNTKSQRAHMLQFLQTKGFLKK